MKSRFYIDWWLITPVLILVTVSLATLSSIDIVYFRTQLISLVLAVFAFLFFSRINLDLLRQLKVPIYIVSLILLIVLFIVGIETRGAVRWVDIFGVSLQFSEILKPFLAVSFAAFLAESSLSKNKQFFLSVALLLPIFLLVTMQPDLGSGLIYAFSGIFVLLVAGFSYYLFGIALIPLLISLPFIWTILHDYQKERILTFVNPTSDPLGTSYNSIQAIIAVGSGVFWGKGWFQSTQSTLRFLPERHTDFIFATIAEGLGFVGAIIILFVFSFLCYRIYLVFRNSEDQFGKIFASSCFAFFLIQGFINIGMNIGLLPIVGVTLPFVSYGGNSLISNAIFLGILTAIINTQRTKNVLEIK